MKRCFDFLKALFRVLPAYQGKLNEYGVAILKSAYAPNRRILRFLRRRGIDLSLYYY